MLHHTIIIVSTSKAKDSIFKVLQRKTRHRSTFRLYMYTKSHLIWLVSYCTKCFTVIKHAEQVVISTIVSHRKRGIKRVRNNTSYFLIVLQK